MFLRTRRPRHRKFTASDGREYSWSWRTSTQEDLEWSVSITCTSSSERCLNSLGDLQCVNANGHTVAWYAVSSGHMFGVEEPYPHLAIGKTYVVF
jgi:hypothetical protein